MLGKPWIETTIGEQATLQRGIDITKAEQRDGKVPVVSSSGVSSYHDTVAVNGPGVVLGRKGIVGSVFFIKEDYWPHDTSLWVKDFHGNHPRFVYYFFKSVAPQIARLDVGSANPTLNRNHVHPMPIIWPPIAEQRAIAAVLGALDDKIDVNQRMNVTLEAMASALFQSWFVDFDPVRAKLAGSLLYGIDTATASQFPAEFQDSVIGPIPSGWRVERVEDIAQRIAMGPFGSNITRDNFVQQGVPVIRGGNLTNGFRDDDFVYLTDSKANDLKNSVAHPGDLIFTHRGTLGQVGIIPLSAKYSKYVVSQSQMLFSVDKEKISPWLVYMFFRSSRGQSSLLAYTSTTGVPAISRPTTSLKAIQLVVPPIDISRRFDEIVKPIFTMQEQNARTIVTLAALRDTLLPMLLSGKLQVRNLT